MLKQRLTAPFKVVYMCDPAILELSTDATQKYRRTRNFEDLDISKCSTPPTVFSCVPLKTKWKHLTDVARDSASAANWSIFRNHVQSATHFDDDNGRPIIEIVDDAIPESKEDLIPIDVVAEIAGVIVEKSMTVNKSFTQPVRYLEEQMLTVAAQALASGAAGDTAKNPTDTSD